MIRTAAADPVKQAAAVQASRERASAPRIRVLPEVSSSPTYVARDGNVPFRARRAIDALVPSAERPLSIHPSSPVKTVRRNRFRRIAAPLAELIEKHTSGADWATIERFADAHGMLVAGGAVRVLVRPVNGTSDAIDPVRLRALGTELKRSRSYVVAEVPLVALPALEQLPGVERVDIPRRFHRLARTSEGVGLTNALSLSAAGIAGAGQSVAVVDVDFTNRTAAQAAGELPNLLYYQAFGPQQPGGDSHGTACAEIVYDMAPGVALHLLLIDDIVDLENARDYCLDRGIPIISMSLGLSAANFCDGTGEVCDIVNDARARGIFWVVAAGNEGDGHWMGPFLDSDGNRWTTFPTNGTERLQVASPGPGYYLDVTLTWNDFPRTDQDYDLYLFNSAGNIVATSDFYQDGNDEPVEQISYLVPWGSLSSYYSVGVRRAFGARPMDIRIIVNTAMRNVVDRVAARSLSTPADAAGAFTVGAIDYRQYSSDSGLEVFSSRGPTYDGRIKPDLTAPDYVSGYTYGPDGFPGTSAATPHVAGAAALMRGLEPTLSAGDLAAVLERFAVDMGTTPGKDTLFGAGRLRLPAWLQESSTLQAGLPQGYFLFGSSLPFWSAVAVYSTSTLQRTAAVYDTLRATAPTVVAGPSTAPVIFVHDLNRSSHPYHLLATAASTTAIAPYLVQWSCRRLLTVDAPAQEPFFPWEIARMHDVFLVAGETYRLHVNAGVGAALALFDSGGSNGYVAPHTGAAVSTATAGAGEASLLFPCPRSDYYGVLVWRLMPRASTDPVVVTVVRVSSGSPEGVIIGTVTSAAGGVPLAGAAVDVLGTNDTRITGTRSAADGTYRLSVPTGTWTIRWSAPGYLPETEIASVVHGTTISLHAALRLAGPFWISGRLLTTSSAPISDATVILSGASTGTFTSSTNGYYEFGGLNRGSYTVIPQALSYVFSPVHRTYAMLENNAPNQDFTGTLVYYLQGTVRDLAGFPVSGVSVTLTGDATRTVVTGADGTYTFGGLTRGNYTVTPTREGWYFEPASYTYVPLTTAQTGQHFTAVRIETDIGEVRITGGSQGFIRSGDVLRIAFRPGATDRVRVRIATLRGTIVWETALYCIAGFPYGVSWQGTTSSGDRLPSGIYLVSVSGGGINAVRRIALVR